MEANTSDAMQIESQIVTHESDILPSNNLETFERKNMAVAVDNDMDVEGVLGTKSSDILSLSTPEKLPIPTSDRILRSAEQRKRSKRLLEDSESVHNLMSNKQRRKAVASIISKVISESMLIEPMVQTEEQIAPKVSVTKSVRKLSAKAKKIAIQNEIQEEIKACKHASQLD
jgi:hypothetical protein